MAGSGQCLYNIDSGTELLDSWINFSRKTYGSLKCTEMWYAMPHNNLGMSSLHRWAQTDNPKNYLKYVIIKDVHNIFKYKYKYASSHSRDFPGTWYELKNCQWVQIDNRHCHAIFFDKIKTTINHRLKDDNLDKIQSKNLTDILIDLKKISQQSQIRTQFEDFFRDVHFDSQLDANPDLIGFENGVYDLRTDQFRDCHPGDYISLTTGNDYKEFEDNDQLITDIHCFMSQIFPDQYLRDNVLIQLASFLDGHNVNKKWNFWANVGSNWGPRGKSTLFHLFQLAFGKYAVKQSPQILNEIAKSQKFGGFHPDVVQLRGVRALHIELDSTDTFDVNILKKGKSLEARSLYHAPIKFECQFKMIIECHQLPSLVHGVSITEFKSRFVENPDPENSYELKKDSNLREKLDVWKEAFMYILLQYYKTYKKQGLIELVSGDQKCN
jgi:phage/plasmid-associated DNA primase